MPLQPLFGANVDPLRSADRDPVAAAQRAESLGYHFVTVQDHPYQHRFHDSWTLLTYITAKTTALTVVPTVSNLPLRPPAMLAKAANTLDQLGGGRLRLGLGAGAFWDAIVAMGGPRREPKEAFDALDEAIDVIGAMWSGEHAVTVEGAHYTIKGVHPGAAPSEALGIWLGVYGRRGLRMVGEKAAGWMPSLNFMGMDRLSAAIARIEDAAAGAGRDPRLIRKIYNINGMIQDSSEGPFVGPVERWIDDLTRLFELGMNGVSFWPNGDHDRQLALFADVVVPTLRDQSA